MRDTAEAVAEIRLGSVMQITPEDRDLKMTLGVVTHIDSWGVKLRLHGGVTVNRTWNLVEPTGGMEIFRADGARWNPDAPSKGVKHHP